MVSYLCFSFYKYFFVTLEKIFRLCYNISTKNSPLFVLYFGVEQKEIKIMKTKKLKGYATLKEARAVAREMTSYYYTDIYLESDGSHSVGKPCDKKAKFVMAIDKSGAKFTKKFVNNPYFGKRLEYVKIK